MGVTGQPSRTAIMRCARGAVRRAGGGAGAGAAEQRTYGRVDEPDGLDGLDE